MTYKPKGRSTVIPRIITDDVDGLVRFIREVFGAKGDVQSGQPTELTIDDSTLMVSDGGGVRRAQGAFLYVYVPDADAAFARAVKAGARTVETLEDMPWGDRRATVEDRWGNTWQIATRLP